MTTLHDLISCHIQDYSKSIAVTYDNGTGKRHIITYGELYQFSKKITDILRSYNTENEIIGLCVELSEDIPAILLGILQVPAAFYFFEPNPIESISCALQNLSVGILIIDIVSFKNLECLLQTLGKGKVNVLMDLRLVIIELSRIKRQKTSGLAYCITTSGSTGIPKMVKVPHRCIVPNIMYLREKYEVSSEDVLFLASPLTFDPSMIDIFLTLSAGARLLITSHYVKVQPEKLSKMLHDYYHVTILQVTPSLMYNFGSKLLRETILNNMSSLRILSMGGERFPPLQVLKSWKDDKNRTKFYNLYGLTEVSCWSSCYEITDEDFRSNKDVQLGNPMYDTTMVVIDENGKEIVKNGFGWLYTGGTHRICQIKDCLLYFDNLRNTGDWMKVDDEGHIFYLQRKDDQVKRFGKRLNLQEIESIILEKLSFIDNCKTILSDERLILFYKLSEDKKSVGKNSFIEEQIKLTLKKALPSHYQPDYFVKVNSFPLNQHGKQDHLFLLKMFKENTVMQCSLEELFIRSWRASLNLPENTLVDQSANFVNVGGDSLMAVRFLDQLELNLGIQLTSLIHSILYNSYAETLSQLIDLISKHKDLQIQSEALIKNGKNLENESIMKNDFLNKNISLSHDNNFKEYNNTFIRKHIEYDDTSIREHDDSSVIECNNEIDKISNKVLPHNNIFSINSDQTSKVHSNSKACLSKNELFGTNSSSAEKQVDQLKNQHLIPLRKRKGCQYEKEVCSLKKSQMICNHKKKMLDTLWTFDTGKCVDASPVISISSISDDGIIFIGSHSHRFYAIQMNNGQMLWESILGDRIESTACVSLCQKFVIVGCYDSFIYILKVSTGEVYWKFKTGNIVKCSPVVDPVTSHIWVGSHDECIYSLDIKFQSNPLKKNLQTGSIFSSPSICMKPYQVYVSTLGGFLYCMEPLHGTIKWKQDFKKPLFTSPCITNDGVVIGCVDGNLYALNHDGYQIWKINTIGQIFSSPICISKNEEMGKEVIVCGSYSNFVYCCDGNGNIQWKTNIQSKIYATPCCNQKSVLNEHQKTSSAILMDNFKLIDTQFITICSTDGNLQILCLDCGSKFASYKLPGEVFSSPVICEENIFLGCRDNNVYCFKLQNL